MSAARVLWVSAEPPDYRRGGGSMRQAHLLEGLARHLGPVDLVLAGHLTEDHLRSRLNAVLELDVAPRRLPASLNRRRLHDLWRVLATRLPAEVTDRQGERLALWSALSSALDGGPSPLRPPYDIVHTEHLGLAGVVPVRTARLDGGLRSLGIQNVPSRMAEQSAALAPGSRQRWLSAREAALAGEFQRRALGYADVVTVVSEADALELGVGPAALVAPNGVDVGRFSPSVPPEEPRLVFTGTLDFAPNVDGVTWFAEEILPRVRAEVPGATLSVVGRSPTPAVAALAQRDGITVVADVDDVAPHLEAARVAVVPLRIGTGSRLKILEAMAAGRPVVSTSVGAEGLDARPGHHLLVADDPAQLSAALVLLCEDSQLAERVGRAGRALVEARYRWDVIARTWAAQLDERRRSIAGG